MTEYEINLAVAKKLGHQPSLEYGVVKIKEELRHGVIIHYDNFDPCNNAQLAWDIMLANDIGITQCLRGDDYCSYRGLWGDGESFDPEHLTCNCFFVTNEKPFVAAMLLFLEI